ncbi:hypothetical protein [Geodermatophilus sp. URMC 62]|uniref:hypothetical protein n=1 Tax=Geodermatophilus sp. URMC 62 TaxID=3423414 RepID=UPI00406D1EF0
MSLSSIALPEQGESTNQPSWAKRLIATGAAAAAIFSAGAATGPEAKAAIYDRGLVTDSVYLSRGETKALAREVDRNSNTIQGATGLGFGAACAATGLGGVASAACAGVGAVGAGVVMDRLANAAEDNNCFRIRFVWVRPTPNPLVRVPAVVGVYNDSSGYCHD